MNVSSGDGLGLGLGLGEASGVGLSCGKFTSGDPGVAVGAALGFDIPGVPTKFTADCSIVRLVKVRLGGEKITPGIIGIIVYVPEARTEKA